MDIIRSRQNPVFKSLIAAKKKGAMMPLEGRRLVEDALSRGMVPKALAVTPEYLEACGPPRCAFTVLTGSLFAHIADTVTPQGIYAIFEIPWAAFSDVVSFEKILVLDALQDPGNVGTIIRTAEAFDFSAVLLTPGTASPFSPKAVRSSMGSCLGVKIAKVSVEDLKTLTHRIISLVPNGKSKLAPPLFEGKVAICLGQEASGVRREILELSHMRVSIPMKGPTESLNVAVAAGIVLACACGAVYE